MLPPRLRPAYRVVQPLVEGLFSFPALWRLHAAGAAGGRTGTDFAAEVLRTLGVEWILSDADLRRLHAVEGPLVVVTNHPYGGLDAVIMLQVLERIRPGRWVMFANQAMCAVPEVAANLIAVDPLGSGEAGRRLNAAGLRAAHRHLNNSDALVGLFPGTRVSHREPSLGGAVCDQPWTDHPVRIAAAAGASLAVLHITGCNSRFFLSLPLRWKRLRALLLCRELVRPPGIPVGVRLAAVLAPGEVKRMTRSAGAGLRLRARCFLRADCDMPRPASVPGAVGNQTPICPEPPAEALAAEIDGLGEEHRVLRSADGEIDVLLFKGERAPVLLRALGRAREITFRAAGQGSGLDCDLTPEDEYYEHLVLWHRGDSALMGAYRLGFTRDILAAKGPAGLYLDHVFRIDPALYEKLGPSIELSRSFVLPEYQRDNNTFPLLWRSLAATAVRRGCPMLFGSVTISNQHHPATRAVLVDYLSRAHADSAGLRALVKARRPFVPATRYHTLVGEAYADSPIEALAPVVDEIEHGERGIPPLMRYYCSLGAKFLAYHVEAAFQDALYCLLRVDMREMPERYRKRLLG